MKASKPEEIHVKMVMNERVLRAPLDASTSEKPRVCGGSNRVKTNGSLPPSSSTFMRTDGRIIHGSLLLILVSLLFKSNKFPAYNLAPSLACCSVLFLFAFSTILVSLTESRVVKSNRIELWILKGQIMGTAQ